MDFSAAPYRLTIDAEKEIEADTVIIATGASAKYLGLEDENKYRGLGQIKDNILKRYLIENE